MLRFGLTLTLALVAWSVAPTAAAAPCERLSAAQKQQARELFAKVYPHACCDENLLRCLKAKKVCKLARRLRDDVCRRLTRGQAPKKIKAALERRARSAAPTGKPVTIDLKGVEVAGDPAAKVQVVVYACARCPFCSKVIPDLHRQVTSGGLKGKVRLYLRPFPIRGHAGSVEGGMAMLAAGQQGKFWPFVLHLYSQFDKFKVERLPAWAKTVGLDGAAFARDLAAAALRKELVASKKEGLRNGVKATPALYISGRKYHGDMDHDSLLDVLEEEADRLAGKAYCDPASKRYFR